MLNLLVTDFLNSSNRLDCCMDFSVLVLVMNASPKDRDFATTLGLNLDVSQFKTCAS